MDISCERCSTEYELDESLLASGQSKVKCTNCGLVFRVQAPSASQRPADPVWQIRTKDGKRFTLNSFDELKSRILTGALTREDQLMKPGKPWKGLFEFTELRNLFLKAPSSPAQDSLTAVKIQNPFNFEDTSPGVARDKVSKEPRVHKTTPYSYPPPVPDTEKTAQNARKTQTDTAASGSNSGSQSSSASLSKSSGPRKTMIGTAASLNPPQPPPTLASPDQTEQAHPPEASTPSSTNPADPSSPSTSTPANVVPWSEQGTTQHFPGVETGAPASGGYKRMSSAPPTMAFASQQDMPTKVSNLQEVMGSQGGGFEQAPNQSSPALAQGVASQNPMASSGSMQSPSMTPRTPSLVLEEEEINLPKKKSRWGLWITLVFLSGFISVGVWKWPEIEPFVEQFKEKIPVLGSSKLNQFISSGNQYLAQGHIASYEKAALELTKASAFSADNPEVLLGLARARVYWANAISFEILDRRETSQNDSDTLEISNFEKIQEKQVQSAEALVEKLLAVSGFANEAQVLWSHVLRLKGFPSAAIEQLSKVQLPDQAVNEKDAQLKSEWNYSHALVSWKQKTESSLQDAESYVIKALDADASSIRARLLLARIQIQKGKKEDALFELATVLVKVPKHPVALSLKQKVSSSAIEPETAEEAKPQELEEGPDETEEKVSSKKSASSSSQDASDGASSSRGYDGYIRRGEFQLEHGRPKAAKDMFKAALRINPSSVEANCGLGYAELDMGRISSSIQYFKKASAKGFGDAFIGLGDAYRRLGKTENAMDAYKAYLKKYPSGSSSFIAKRQLAALERSIPKESSVKETTTLKAEPTPMEAKENEPEQAKANSQELTPTKNDSKNKDSLEEEENPKAAKSPSQTGDQAPISF